MRGAFDIYALNRGVVAREALARLDVKRLAWAAEQQKNIIPMAVGPGRLRPGLGYLDVVAEGLGATAARMLPFVFSIDDTALLEVSDGGIRVWVDDAPVARATVTASITNTTFDSNVTGWTDQDEAGASSVWATGGYMSLTGNGTAVAIREQQVTVNEAGTAHALRIVIQRGPVVLRIGSSSLGSEYMRDTTLGTGTHDIVFTPTGDFYLQFRNALNRAVLVDSVTINSGATLALPSPYAAADLGRIRARQSGDVIYLACAGYQQRKIERRANGSWSIVLYQPTDGPFRSENTAPTTIASSAISGNVTLTASNALFDDDHVGALWSITSVGQRVEQEITAENVFSNAIRVTGVEESRRFSVTVTGTFTATVTLQRSFDDEVTWEDVTTYTAATSTTPAADGFDNQIVHYRIGVKTGDYTSGTIDVALNYSPGSITGIVRITSVASTLSAGAEVIQPLGGTAATSTWSEGLWSEFRGWPSSVEMHDGRLWWAGKDRFVGSITDAFESFDQETEGDSGPIVRSIGFGPVDNINWLLSLSRLMAGTDMAELSCRSSSFDEPLTPVNFTPKKAGTQGTSAVEAIEVDGHGLFIQRSATSLYELAFSIETQDYSERELTRLVPGFLSPGVVAMAVQRKPETRIHCVRSDGTVGMLVYDRDEELMAWVDIETDGTVEDVCVLPSADEEDAVYYIVTRTIGGTPSLYLERWAKESESLGAATHKMADSYVFAAASASTITGLDHLEGETVSAWGVSGGVSNYIGSFTVASGSITLGASYTNRCAGLTYEGRFKGAKLGYVVAPGQSSFGQKKRISKLGLILFDTHPDGLTFGPDFDNMDALPAIKDGTTMTSTTQSEYDEEAITFPGRWDTDSRVCIKMQAPYPATVAAIAVHMEAHST